jgi:hypothetical protein
MTASSVTKIDPIGIRRSRHGDIIWIAMNLDRRTGHVRPFQSEPRRAQDARGSFTDLLYS